MNRHGMTRREFLRAAAALGVTATVAPLARLLAASSAADARLVASPHWLDQAGNIRFRQDGISKITGSKVFAFDIRARDMPGWPQQQAYAFMIRTTRCDRVYEGVDLSMLDDGLKPDRLVVAADLKRDGVAMPEPDFYGQLLLAEGTVPTMLGQPAALLVYHDYPRFRAAKARLHFDPAVIRWGSEGAPVERAPYGVSRFVRIGGATPYDDDVFSPMIHEGPDTDEAVAAHAKTIADLLAAPPPGQRVFERQFASQSVDPAALEPDNGTAWYDRATRTLHLVAATQAPYVVATQAMTMAKASRLGIDAFRFYPTSTVGYGQKEHSSFPYYVTMAALYGDGRPVRLALDRWEHFQSAIKRHAFWFDTQIAVDTHTGKFTALKSQMAADGGGTANFSAAVGQVAATAIQSIYYFPLNDLSVTVHASRAVTAGSMRGFGTLQSMTSMEMMVDEIAQVLGIDAIELRRRNVLHTGMKNTQGAVPAGSMRAHELLDNAAAHPLWRERDRRKKVYEAKRPGYFYGVGFACVQKDYGTGAEAAIAQIQFDAKGGIRLRHVVTEIGTGATTSQIQVVTDMLGRPAQTVEFAVVDWPELKLVSNENPYGNTQAEEDRFSKNPHWVPTLTSPASASNSAFYMSHATREAARVLFDYGIWPAAMAIWGNGSGGGQAAPLSIRREDARWVDGMLVAPSLEPLSFERIAMVAHQRGLVTGATVHTFNRWAWASARFPMGSGTYEAPIDALAVRYGGAADESTHGYTFVPRVSVDYPPTQRNKAGVVYYAPHASLVELAVNPGTGEVDLLSHHHVMDCGRMIVPAFVSGQHQGGIAMGIGHALYEELPRYEEGPGNGQWNFNRYRLPRASDVAVWRQTAQYLPPLSPSDPPKGIAEVVMIPVVAAIANGVAHATGKRFYELPLSPERIKAALA
ncbi:xanthine dehydrogenase family protein molybdopterin-binding subunit [Dyella sp.]|uniref:xanthine dehydrogenase family protein molybdopterin-binding subunit n=1 Tax=Dyella sp. TaxID=1869338 RepID=UPI002ED45147